ncbi:TlpA family protein disulfide reductase [Leptolyngbya sp. 7M]|uniref:TlpA family protein disulfide reductase n=1 Tax=Leptolyngbya sp. 7M TaxID=2812896 RepID=UPI001B8CE9C8|nr:TlpA disulfide reductase family protein [Leptolyngbya sp. 7M]QYO66924.1 TlpA family protein disulfide reductase [Leptolyngbya sp. 7M]
MRLLQLSILIVWLSVVSVAQQQLKPGQPAPEFNAQTLDGKAVSLSELQGKVVVLTFWSTKCIICHNEIPKLNQIAARYQGQDVVFLALTMENETRLEPYLRKNRFDFEIVPNSFGVVLKYADMDAGGRINMGFPAYFLIGKSGRIELRDDGWDKSVKLDSQISRLLRSE